MYQHGFIICIELFYRCHLLHQKASKCFQKSRRTRGIYPPTIISNNPHVSSSSFCVALVRFITLIYLIQPVVSVSLSPLVNLDDTEQNQISFEIPGNDSLILFKDPDAIVLYSTSLEFNRQLLQIDRIVDFSHFALSNMNLVDTLAPLIDMNHYAMPKNAFIHKEFEYIISKESVDYEHCRFYCASQQASLIDQPRHFHAIRSVYPTDVLWLESKTSVRHKDTETLYSIFFGEKYLYPTNTLTHRKIPRIFYQKKEQLHRIDEIEKYYQYYDSQGQSYWAANAYELLTRVSSTNNIEIILPVPNTVLKIAQAQCPCVRSLGENRRLFSDMRDQLTAVAVQREKLGFFIENLRLKTGYVPRLLRFTQLTKNHSRVMTSEPYQLNTFAPLTPVKEPWLNDRQDIALAPVVMKFVATKIGAPMVLSLFKPYFNKFISSLNAKTFTYSGKQPSHSLLPKSVRISGIDHSLTNFSIILEINNLPMFEERKRKSFTDNTRLLRNMSVINDALANFLQHDIENLVINVAADHVNANIDFNYPVIVSVEKADSFWLFRLYFTTIMDTPTATNFKLFNLPLNLIDDEYFASDLPAKFSSDGFTYAFEQAFANKGLTNCIDNILAGSFSDECTHEKIPKTKIVKGFHVAYYDIYYILTDEPSHLKITCPGKLTHHNNLVRDVIVIGASPACNIALVLPTGTLNVKHNTSFAGPIKDPIFLFEYDINNKNSVMDYHLILIITIGSCVLALIIIFTTVIYYLTCHKTTEIIEMRDEIQTSSPTSSETSVETIRSITRSQRVQFNTTL